LAVAAAACLEGGDAKRALREITEARALVDAMGGSEDGDALVRWVQARVLEANGDLAGARACIDDAAHRLYQRAERLPDDAARARFFAGVPEHAGTVALAARLMPSPL
jgi:hypothetical protein